MDDAGPCVQILAFGSKGHSRELAARVLPVEHAAGIEAGDMGAEGTADPLDQAVLLHQGPLGV